MIRRTAILLTLATVLVASCAPSPTPTPPPQPTVVPGPTVTPIPPQPIEVRAGGFAAYVPVEVDVTPAVPTYTPDLSAVVNSDLASRLTDAQRATLEANGFVVVPQGFEQIYQIYQQAKDAGIPTFVTTDAVLHAFHILYDYALRLAEIEHFVGDLDALNAAMLKAAEVDYAATDGPVQEATRQNMAFFGVATKLLTPGADVPGVVRDVVEEELALIEAHAGIACSPIFGQGCAAPDCSSQPHTCEDYSQYVPRGHYTRNEDFERYFRAMMWYGRLGFHLTTPRDPEAARRETRSALLIVRALHGTQAGDDPALAVWERIYEPTVFFVGSADDLTVYDYAAVAQQVYGGLPAPATLGSANEAQLDTFIATARQLRPPAIVGGYVTDQDDPEEVTMAFRFMGQRFIPDSYIFQQLVYNQVKQYRGTDIPFTMSPSQAGPVRGFPRGLDVPAVLGNDHALEILTAEGDVDYSGYAEQLGKLQDEFAALPAEQWTANLYWNWLHTLNPLLEEKSAGYPYFMQSPTWADKDLHTWLGSWTELRHDTILYAKQSYAIMVTSAMPEAERVPGYVEPQPEVYARLAALTDQMETGLGGRDLLNKEMAEKLKVMKELLLTLKDISEKELHDQKLNEEDFDIIRAVGGVLENLTTFSEEIEGEITSQADERMALIADVHTDPNTNQVLEEGVGDAFPIYVVVPMEGRQMVTLGGVFSYYEFKWPISNRLTDEAWQELSPLPDRPAWTESFIVE
jgi:hypothetical protein